MTEQVYQISRHIVIENVSWIFIPLRFYTLDKFRKEECLTMYILEIEGCRKSTHNGDISVNRRIAAVRLKNGKPGVKVMILITDNIFNQA